METIEYDWTESRTHCFREGEQWNGRTQLESIRQAARVWARTHGRTVRTFLDPQWKNCRGGRVLKVTFHLKTR